MLKNNTFSIAAHRLYLGQGRWLENGVLVLDDEARILKFFSLSAEQVEPAGTIFYNGIIACTDFDLPQSAWISAGNSDLIGDFETVLERKNRGVRFSLGSKTRPILFESIDVSEPKITAQTVVNFV